jgi:hypothetical protein
VLSGTAWGALGLAVAALALLPGCGGTKDSGSQDAPSTIEPTKGATSPTQAPRKPRPPSLQRARCPAGAANCASATGPIIYEQRVDPDGEGDAHLVIADTPGVTLPGVTVIDVEPAIRPHPLPGAGEWVSAAGPVYPGSYGQRQIEATVLNLAR